MQESAILKECKINFSRSSGSGGQNVNKVSTKVEIRFNVTHSQTLSDYQKKMISIRYEHRINSDGEIIVTSQKSRSQAFNKEDAEQKLLTLLKQALVKQKARIKTKPTRSSKEKRLTLKKQNSIKKANRRMNSDD